MLRFLFVFFLSVATPVVVTHAAESFNARLAEANRLLDAGKLNEALAEVKVAASLDTNRFEAPFLAAVIFLEQKRAEPARVALNAALALAPEEKKAQISVLKGEIDALTKSDFGVAIHQTEGSATRTPPRRQLDTLMMIINEADQAKLDIDRKKLLFEFLAKSQVFVADYPDHLPIWSLRAVAALELRRKSDGWAAGRQLKRLGAEGRDDAKLRQIIAALDRKGWWTDAPPVTNWLHLATNNSISLAELRRLAENDDTAAQVALGRRLLSTSSSDREVLVWAEKASGAGDPDGMDLLATVFLNSWAGIQKNESEGIRLLTQAAQSGSANAQFTMGLKFSWGGSGVAKDPKLAEMYLTNALGGGINEAARTLAGIYYHEFKDHARAVHVLRAYVSDNAPGADPARAEAWIHEKSVLAWVLATSSNAAVRNGKEALLNAKEALQACELLPTRNELGYNSRAFHSAQASASLAAAFAETGDFPNAIKAEDQCAHHTRSAYSDRDTGKYKARDSEQRIKKYKKGIAHRTDRLFGP